VPDASCVVDETLGSLRWHAGVVRAYHTTVPSCGACHVVNDTLGLCAGLVQASMLFSAEMWELYVVA